MRLLVLGGTSFVGRHLVETALASGNEVTLVHRGRTNPGLFPQAEHRHGDRASGDYQALASGDWDATVDVTAYVPRQVNQALDALDGRQGHYVVVSSVSAYDPALATPDEGSPRYAPPAPTTETVDEHSYGPLKAECERVAQHRLGEQGVAVVRPTFVAGPYDPTDRFTYWARPMAAGGRVPVAWPDEPVQVVDARDLGAFLLELAGNGAAGVFDAVGPFGALRVLLDDLAVPGRPYELVDVTARLDAAGVALPLVQGDPADRPLMTRTGERALAAGLRVRSLRETASDTVAWDVQRGQPALRVGPDEATRAALLAS
ncbi:MAG: NAD-dependent epimerase/dehydratase family protein [Jiangellales bacterium]